MKVKGLFKEKEVLYEESFWTGKKELTIAGIKLQKKNRNTFLMKEQENQMKEVVVKGNFFIGMSLIIDEETYVLVKNKWYESVLIIFPLLGVIVGVLCGAIGGLLSVLFGFLGGLVNANLLRSNQKITVKVLVSILVGIAVNVAWFMICAGIAGGIAALFK